MKTLTVIIAEAAVVQKASCAWLHIAITLQAHCEFNYTTAQTIPWSRTGYVHCGPTLSWHTSVELDFGDQTWCGPYWKRTLKLLIILILVGHCTCAKDQTVQNLEMLWDDYFRITCMQPNPIPAAAENMLYAICCVVECISGGFSIKATKQCFVINIK